MKTVMLFAVLFAAPSRSQVPADPKTVACKASAPKASAGGPQATEYTKARGCTWVFNYEPGRWSIFVRDGARWLKHPKGKTVKLSAQSVTVLGQRCKGGAGGDTTATGADSAQFQAGACR